MQFLPFSLFPLFIFSSCTFISVYPWPFWTSGAFGRPRQTSHILCIRLKTRVGSESVWQKSPDEELPDTDPYTYRGRWSWDRHRTGFAYTPDPPLDKGWIRIRMAKITGWEAFGYGSIHLPGALELGPPPDRLRIYSGSVFRQGLGPNPYGQNHRMRSLRIRIRTPTWGVVAGTATGQA